MRLVALFGVLTLKRINDSLLAAKKHNLLVFAWTVNEPADIDIMIDLGVDAIVTDYPPRVKKCLASKGMNWNTALSG